MIKKMPVVLLVSLFLCFFLISSAYTQKKKKYALLIGVDYKGILALDYTRQDAIELGKILRNNFGYKTKILTKRNETTRKAIEKAFSDLKKQSNAYDQIIIFFSGHGKQDNNSSEVGYLLPYDVNTEDLYTSAIDMSTFQNLSKTLKSKQVLFILDCCYSGIIGSYSNMDISGGDKMLRSRQILTAGRSGQKAIMYVAKGFSLYTYYLIRALSHGRDYLIADSDKDGELTAWDLQTYILKKVSAHTKENQTPRIYNYTEDDGIFLFQYKKQTNIPVVMPISNLNNKIKNLKTSSESRKIEKKAADLIEMVFVEGGTFKMGSNKYGDEKPVHKVYVNSFYISKYEVTQAQWKKIMKNNPSRFKGDHLPVENVSWNDCQEFIRKLNQQTGEGYRLPTEAEWEYAARGGNKSRGYTYSGSNNADEVAWRGERFDKGSTHPVGKKQANELKIYDMSGNVWEWCQDWYDKNYYKNSPKKNPQGPESGSDRVLRGGGWGDDARNCRSADRSYDSPGNRGNGIGFRLVFVPQSVGSSFNIPYEQKRIVRTE